MSRPPALARLIVRLLPLGTRRDEIERDLEEVATRHRAASGSAMRRRYWKETLSLLVWAARRSRRPATSPRTRGDAMNSLIQDGRVALRGIARQPAYAALAVATLALGVGATTLMFTVVEGVLLKPLPLAEPDRLMIVWESTPRSPQNVASAANYADWRDQNDVFEELATMAFWGPTLSGVDEPRRLSGLLVTANFLTVMGLEPVAGRDFLASEDALGAERVVMLSEALWRESFGADPNVVGGTIALSTGVHTVVGIAPSELERAGIGNDVFMPIVLEEGDWLDYRGRHNMTVLGRLADGVTEQRAQAQMDAIAARLAAAYPEDNAGYGVDVEPYKAAIVDQAEQPLVMLLAAVGFVLLIACANVANLTLARTVSRRGELAVCAALGAGRGRLIQRVAVESGLVAAAGGVVGIGAAYLALDLVVAAVPSTVPRLDEISMSNGVLAFGLGATALTVLLSGLLPALRHTGARLSGSLGDVSSRATGGRGEQRLRDVLVVVELALAVVLLVGAGLFLRSLVALGNVDLGLDGDGVMTARTYLPPDPYQDPRLARARLDGILESVRALPGVERAAIASHLPLANQGMTSGFDILGGEQSGPNGPQGSFRVVSPGYFSTLGIPIVEGRAFTDADRVGGPLVVVVNAELADRYFPDGALGERIGYRVDADEQRLFAEIVGVAGSVHHFGPGLPPVPEIYEPLGQAEETFRWFGRSVAVIARTAGPMAPLGAAMREVLRDADPNLPVYQIQPLDDFLARATTTPRFHARLLGIFGALATLLAAVGVYGVLSLNVRMRVREIGLRQALGADRRDVVRNVVARGLRLAAAGSAAGLVAAVVLARYVESLLFGVGRADPVTLVSAPLLLAATAALACWLPARRAARVDPIVALRDI